MSINLFNPGVMVHYECQLGLQGREMMGQHKEACLEVGQQVLY